MLKYIFLLTIITSSYLFAQPAPTRDSQGEATFSTDGIWHKNMELICPINYNTLQENEMIECFSIGNDMYYIGAFNEESESYISIDKLTNPRSPEQSFRKIIITANGETETRVPLKQVMIWKKKVNETDYNTYAICVVDYPNKVSVNSIKYDVKALVINIDEVLEWGHKNIHIRDLEDRSQTIETETGMKNNNSNIYLGFLPEFRTTAHPYFFQANCWELDIYRRVHTLTIDPASSVATFSHLVNGYYEEGGVKKTDAFVDVFVLDGIPSYSGNYYGIENHPDFSSTTTPIILSRLLKDDRPIRVTIDDETSYPTGWPKVSAVHETHSHRIKKLDMNGNPLMPMEFEADKISLNIAFAGGHSPDTVGCTDFPLEKLIGKGGFGIVDIDYSDPFNCNVDFKQWWDGHPDRQNADYNSSPETFGGSDSWFEGVGHTIESIHVDMKNHFFITAHELAGSEYLVKEDGNQFIPPPSTLPNIRPYQPYSVRTSNAGGAIISGASRDLNSNKHYFDDRRIANNLKLWGGDRAHHLIRGVGSESSDTWDDADSGPLAIYDVLEQSPADRAAGNFFPLQHTGESEDVNCDVSNNSRAPNTTHHMKTYYGVRGSLDNLDTKMLTEIFMGTYVGGARVIDIKNFLRTGDINDNITYAQDTIFESACLIIIRL